MDVTKAPPLDPRTSRAGDTLASSGMQIGNIAMNFMMAGVVFDRLKSEAAALNADAVVGINTYIIELGSSMVEILRWAPRCAR